MSVITIIGLDLAKNVFQVHGVDAEGKVQARRQLRERRAEHTLEQRPGHGCIHTSVAMRPLRRSRRCEYQRDGSAMVQWLPPWM